MGDVVKGKFRKQQYKPNPGFSFNPLRDFPRNKGCFCGGPRKFKVCCFPIQPIAIDESSAKKISARWDDLLNGKLTIQPAIKSPPEKQGDCIPNYISDTVKSPSTNQT